MLLFTTINLAGAKFLSDSNVVIVIWKTLVPVLAIVVVASLQFNTSNFHAGGGFMPFKFHGVFAALTGGVVFALQGFEQAVQLAGEARNPKKDVSRAILAAMAIGALLYSLLQVVMIGGLDPHNLVKGWAQPLGTDPSDYGAWYTVALAVGAGWLAKVILVDAVISPAGTGVVYVATSARLSYALGEETRTAICVDAHEQEESADRFDIVVNRRRLNCFRTIQELGGIGKCHHRRHRYHVCICTSRAGSASQD
jgi:amino acid transporter